jgi:hypothetical protein
MSNTSDQTTSSDRKIAASLLTEALYITSDLAHWRAVRPSHQTDAQAVAGFIERAASRYRRDPTQSNALATLAGALALIQADQPESDGANHAP